MIKALTLSLLLSLPGCALFSPAQDTVALVATEYTCTAADTATEVAILNFDRLSQSTKDAVTKARDVLRPVCTQDNPPSVSSTVKVTLDIALAQLAAAAAEGTR